jgi:hypothetical protein
LRRSRSLPDDVVVIDDDGAVLIPAALVEEVARVAPEQERLETWIMEEVANGASLPGLSPTNEENLKRYKDGVAGTEQGLGTGVRIDV